MSAQGTSSNAMEMKDYIAVFKRRRAVFLFTVGVAVLLALAIALSLPPAYRSTATILIKRQMVPQDVVQSTVTGYIQERLQGISKQVLTPERLVELAKTVDIYGPDSDAMTTQDIAEGMLRSIEVATQDVEVSGESGRPQVATVAFTLSFKAPTPEKAQQGAERLANLYMDYDRTARVEQARTTSEFLARQADNLQKDIVEMENSLALFKKQNIVQLPEYTDTNMRLLETTDGRIERSEERIRELTDRIASLQSQLATTARHSELYSETGERVLTPNDRLAMLRSQYIAKTATYSSDHPDIQRLKREIALLEKEAGRGGEYATLSQTLDSRRAELAGLRERYSDQHPDVVKLRSQVADLEKQLAALPVQAGSTAAADTPAGNPAYISLQTDIKTLQANLEAEKQNTEALKQRRQEYEARLFDTPEVEREYLRLSRDYDNAVARYRELKDKYHAAKAAEQLEEQDKAQRFVLVGEPVVPEDPEPPGKRVIVMLGLVVGIGGGLGSATIAEYMDRTVRGIRGVTTVFGAPPLATIPYVDSGAEAARKCFGTAAKFLLALIALGFAVLAYQTYTTESAEPAGVAGDSGTEERR